MKNIIQLPNQKEVKDLSQNIKKIKNEFAEASNTSITKEKNF